MVEIGLFPVTQQQLEHHFEKFSEIIGNPLIFEAVCDTIKEHNRLAITQIAEEAVKKLMGNLDEILKRNMSNEKTLKEYDAAIKKCTRFLAPLEISNTVIKLEGMTKDLQEGYLFDRILDSFFGVLQKISEFYQESLENEIELKTFVLE